MAKDTNPGVPRTYNRIVVLLEVMETAALDTGLVTVNADAMAKEIDATGHIALYGIHFDTNRAELKPESDAALQEIAKLLKQDPELRLLVVGHTDNVGGYDANMTLSERRAAAVFQALTSKHGIAAARLRAAGVGMAAPVAHQRDRRRTRKEPARGTGASVASEDSDKKAEVTRQHRNLADSFASLAALKFSWRFPAS